jgi:hypothetical protein
LVYFNGKSEEPLKIQKPTLPLFKEAQAQVAELFTQSKRVWAGYLKTTQKIYKKIFWLGPDICYF